MTEPYDGAGHRGADSGHEAPPPPLPPPPSAFPPSPHPPSPHAGTGAGQATAYPHVYAPAQPWDAPRHRPGATLAVGWTLFGLSVPLNVLVGFFAGFIGIFSLIEPGWWTALLFGIPVVLLAGTIVALARLIRRRPSIVLCSVLLAVGVAAWLLGRGSVF
ncbi:hypothetical protein [Litorihabitans aurantiacus]|uniref:Uncharacterized protein n=1 Tax=Litorihabitans aurantiacus TaxID=1930061 RepID=A0AA37UH23_9MICO|nr:hypothetical protein [Litorihabitans aurantiacus]GMA30309.1 hypothetical protein GCM10025875_03010 [Litorihabitans aurantiacus]